MFWLTLWIPLEYVIVAWLANIERFERLLANQLSWQQDVNTVLIDDARYIVTTLRTIAADEAISAPTRTTLGPVEREIGWRVNGGLLWPDAQRIAFYITIAAGALRREAAATEAPRRSRVERAFEHLNRSLIVDEGLRQRWTSAFAEREESCERLGAVHMLLHGVFAFKVNAAGGRTDLVLGGELEITPAVTGSETLALTEWKLVRSDGDRDSIARDARRQAELYAAGVLAGVELRATRFIALVSLGNGAAIPDVRQGAVLYRHVNVVIESATPSVVARRARGRSSEARAPRAPASQRARTPKGARSAPSRRS
jgi:hypothetical protein